MVASYSSALATAKDQVRFWLGDTVDGSWLITDDLEITYVLTLETNVVVAAALLADQLANKYARVPDVTVGRKTVSGSALSKAFSDRAARLRDMASVAQDASHVAAPYAAGLSISEELDDRQDSDLPVPVFGAVGASTVRSWPDVWRDIA